MTSTVAWTRHNFVLSGFPYHDGRVIELNYHEATNDPAFGRILTIKIRNTNGGVVTIRFLSLQAINILEFLISPIVNDIEVFKVEEIVAAEVRQSFWNRLLPPGENIDAERRNMEIDRLSASHKTCFFVAVYASYGASLALICKDICVELSN